MGKISRSVLPKGGRRGQTGLKGKIHRSVSRVPVKKTIMRDRAQDYHGVDKLEVGEEEAHDVHSELTMPLLCATTRDLFLLKKKQL